jgi:hypothetical protein
LLPFRDKERVDVPLMLETWFQFFDFENRKTEHMQFGILKTVDEYLNG